MEMTDRMESILSSVKKYRYMILAVLAGILLMTIPEGTSPAAAEKSDTVMEQQNLQESLSEILSQIEGAGSVEVLLTEAQGEVMIYQTDDHISSDSQRSDTVLITNSEREEAGLVRQIIPAVYQGAVIVCTGADRAQVRLSIVEAVKSATGLTADRITVLKMK